MILRCECSDSPRYETREMDGFKWRRLKCTCKECTMWFEIEGLGVNERIVAQWNRTRSRNEKTTRVCK
jgi:hypothetical protein